MDTFKTVSGRQQRYSADLSSDSNVVNTNQLGISVFYKQPNTPDQVQLQYPPGPSGKTLEFKLNPI